MKKTPFYKRFIRPVKHALGYVIIVIGIWKMRLLPRKLAFVGASIWGRMMCSLLRSDRNRALANLEIAFPEMLPIERQHIARETFCQTALNLADACCAKKLVYSEPPVWKIEGKEHLENFYKKYGGGIVITGHIGCFELIPGIIGRLGYKVAVVGRRLYDERVDRLLIKQRESLGIVNIPSDAHPRVLANLIRDGYLIGTLMDTYTESVDGIPARFFGREVRTISGPIAIARLVGQPVLPMAIYRENKYRFLLRILPPLEIPKTSDKTADIVDSLNRANGIIEELIRFRPDQWIWYHDRFRE